MLAAHLRTCANAVRAWAWGLSAFVLGACGGGGGGDGVDGIRLQGEPTAASTPVVPDPVVAAAPSAAALPAAPAAPPAPALAGIARMVVAGDSLADVGTFGYKFTVQDASQAAGFPVWPELVAVRYGLAPGCSFFRENTQGELVRREAAACTNFAVGGARILRGDGPKAITSQLQSAGDAIGRFAPDDVILVDGGGNDASELAAAYVAAVLSRSGVLAYLAFLGREVSIGDLVGTARGDDSLGRAAVLYMEDAADTLADSIAAHALGRGATRVVVMNLPDVTITPRFTAALERVSREDAGDAAAVRRTIQSAVGAFNARLQARLGHDARVLLVDVHTAMNERFARAAEFGLTEIVRAACPVTDTNALGLPRWSLQTCSSDLLDATPGKSPGWWAGWAFSDGFHPTPAGHRLLAQVVLGALAARRP
jgi:outer membrane lipase/esterase